MRGLGPFWGCSMSQSTIGVFSENAQKVLKEIDKTLTSSAKIKKDRFTLFDRANVWPYTTIAHQLLVEWLPATVDQKGRARFRGDLSLCKFHLILQIRVPWSTPDKVTAKSDNKELKIVYFTWLYLHTYRKSSWKNQWTLGRVPEFNLAFVPCCILY